MASNVLLVFAGIGVIIFIGFLGTLLFERTKIPDILILIFIGLFLGPILFSYFGIDLFVSAGFEGISLLETIAPYFAALALVIILFEGGLNLNLETVMSQLGTAIIHTGIAFIGTMFMTAIICYFFLGIVDIAIGLLLGCILGGVSSAVVLPIMSGVTAKEDTKCILALESVLSDVLCIVTALILIEILKGGATDTGVLIQHLLAAFILAGFIGLLFGVAWLGVLRRIQGKPFAFMVTIAALFVLYAGVEYIQVSGAIAALVFGLVLSNSQEISRMFKMKTRFILDEKLKEFHSEITFVVRTFFFVYLGMTFTLNLTAGWSAYNADLLPFGLTLPSVILANPIYWFLLVMVLIFIGIFIVRYVASSVTCSINNELKEDKPFFYTMLPRGLAAAVLAALPFAIPEFIDPLTHNTTAYVSLMEPHQDLFLNMAFMMIVLTVIATTIGVTSIESSRKKKMENGPAEGGDEWSAKSRMWKVHKSKKEELKKTGEDTKWQNKKGVKPVKVQPPPPAPPPPARKPVQSRSPSPSLQRDSHPLARRAEKAKSRPVPKKKD